MNSPQVLTVPLRDRPAINSAAKTYLRRFPYADEGVVLREIANAGFDLPVVETEIIRTPKGPRLVITFNSGDTLILPQE